jgi:hypothetical protein
MEKRLGRTLVKVPLEAAVVTTADHGGYLAGECRACGASGWLDSLGRTKNMPQKGAHMTHKKSCPVGQVLSRDKGYVKELSKDA